MHYNPDRHHRRSIRLPRHDYANTGAYFVTICTRHRAPLFGSIRNGIMNLSDYGRIVNSVWQGLPEHYPYVTLDEFVVMPDHIHGIIMINDNAKLAIPGTCEYAQHTPFVIPCVVERPQPKTVGAQFNCALLKPDFTQPQTVRLIDTERARLNRAPTEPTWMMNDISGDDNDIIGMEMIAVPKHPLGQIVGSLKSFSTREINRVRDMRGTSAWQRNYYERVIRNDDELNRIRTYIAENPARWPHRHGHAAD